MADNDKEAVSKARMSINETAPASLHTYLEIELTGGGFDGRLYIEPAEITVNNICKRLSIEIQEEVPF